MIKLQELLDCGYPGGPKVDKLAKQGTPNIKLPKADIKNMDFSFSGIKTAIINLHHKNPEINKADLCASFEKVATDMLIDNVDKAQDNFNIKNIVLAGGVSANSYIRDRFMEYGKNKNIKVYFPELKLCTDNAAMIASAGHYNFLNNNIADLYLNAIPNLKLK